MRKILFTAFAIFAILGCGSGDNAVCMTCGDSDPINGDTGYAYCLYNNRGGYYSCAYMGIRECEGKSYGKDNTCGGFTLSSSSFRSSSSLRSSSSSRPSSSSSLRSSSSSRPSSSSSLSGGGGNCPNAVTGNGTIFCGGQTYKTVKINNQTWMAENLNYDVLGSICYDYNIDKCNEYGKLYDWATAMNIDSKYNNQLWNGSDENHRGICPNGWHIPSNDDWDELIDFAGGYEIAGTKLKARDGWNSYSGVPFGTDDHGFSALPGGECSDGYFGGNGGNWWSSSEISSLSASFWGMYNHSESVFGLGFYKDFMYSVRCVKDY
ncbi:MAG: hypothetical protein LBC87_11185 [Fibromonadaceae bacterium]|jgi:uncharacterized protein (TIGR02145 family)|nr:hypothetical protein [Fibromonadaceae bacterium]